MWDFAKSNPFIFFLCVCAVGYAASEIWGHTMRAVASFATGKYIEPVEVADDDDE